MAKKWTDEEIKLLKENYPYMDCNELYDLLNKNRSKSSIESKAMEFKLYKFKKQAKEGYQFCKKCGRELPIEYKYFPKLKSEKNFRQVCRECSAHFKGFLDDNYKLPKQWSKEENKTFIEIYPNYTNEELIEKFYPDSTNKQLQEKAYGLGIYKTNETNVRRYEQQGKKMIGKFVGRQVSEETRKKLSETKKKQYAEGVYISNWKGRVVSEEEKELSRQRVMGKWKGEKNPRHINPLKGSDNGRWSGGITNLYQFLRENIIEWKERSMRYCNYKCIITGDYFDNIHHLTSFKDIVYEAMKELNLKVNQNVSDYSEELRKDLINKINELHIKYGYGLCLSKDIHTLYHKNYGYTKFTKESFIDFINRYFNKEFDNDLTDKHKSENSKVNYEEAIRLASFIIEKEGEKCG